MIHSNLILLHVIHHNCSYFLLTENRDYDCGDQHCALFKVRFLAGESKTTLSIRILNDTEMECNENATVQINFAPNFERVEPYRANITIMDVERGKSLTLYVFYYNK